MKTSKCIAFLATEAYDCWLKVKVTQWCLTPFARGSSQPRDRTQVFTSTLPAEPPGKPKDTGVGSLSLLQQIFPTQESNQVSCIAGGFFTSWATREARMTVDYMPFFSNSKAARLFLLRLDLEKYC